MLGILVSQKVFSVIFGDLFFFFELGLNGSGLGLMICSQDLFTILTITICNKITEETLR